MLEATYYFYQRIVEIHGVYESPDSQQYDYYDLYENGECINLGDPLYEWPTHEQVKAFLDNNVLNERKE